MSVLRGRDGQDSGNPIPKGRRILEIRGQDQGLGFLPALLRLRATGRVTGPGLGMGGGGVIGVPKGQAA